MARPRNVLFYEIPLPDKLPEGIEWLRKYHRNSQLLIEYLVENGAKSTAYHTAVRCLTLFRDYLLANELIYSAALAEKWCSDNAPLVKGYEITLTRLQDFYEFGEVQLWNAYPYVVQYDLSLNEYWSSMLGDFSRSLPGEWKLTYQKAVRNAAARFLYGIQGSGITNLSQITYITLDQYLEKDHHASHNSTVKYICIIGDFLLVMADAGRCCHGLGWYYYFKKSGHIVLNDDLSEAQAERIEAAREKSMEFPSEEYALLIPDFLAELEALGYSGSPIKTSRFVLYNLLVFLQMNGLGYHEEISAVWVEYAKEHWQLTGWKQSRRTFLLFDNYCRQNAVMPQTIFRGNALKYKSLPTWCLTELEAFINQKQREGWKKSTVDMYRSSVARFCSYAAALGLDSFQEITPETVKEFNCHDLHSTAEGKNAYNGRIRKFLKYLEQKGTIPYGIHHALYAKAAPKEQIVTILNESERDQIRLAGINAVTPLELRDYAMVMVGLYMGLRAIDVAGIRISDINWDTQSIRVLQEKTSYEIEVPMPTVVGNAIYRYIKEGRHPSESPYVFIKNRAPYDRIQSSACLDGLIRILPSLKGRGYHVTRRTFATEQLRKSTNRHVIADLLGHRDTTSLYHYLQHDEDRMRLCPISMQEAGISCRGGLYD